MPVLTRSALESSPLADLHEIASELGIDGFRRLRKAELVDTILGRQDPDGLAAAEEEEAAAAEAEPEAEAEADAETTDDAGTEVVAAARPRSAPAPRPKPAEERSEAEAEEDEDDDETPRAHPPRRARPWPPRARLGPRRGGDEGDQGAP